MSDQYIVENDNSIVLKLQAKTQSHIQKMEVWSDSIDIYVKASPKKGKANKEIIQFLAYILEIDTSAIVIRRGHRSSIKIVEIFNISKENVEKMLAKAQQVQMKL